MPAKTEKKIYKTYKILPLYFNLFYACLSISSRNNITDYVIQEFMKENPNDLPRFTKAELLEYMISQVKEKSIYKLRSQEKSRLNDLINELKQRRITLDNIRVPFNTYTSKETQEDIAYLSNSTKTKGAVLELAIDNYINSISNFHFDMIKLAMNYNTQKTEEIESK